MNHYVHPWKTNMETQNDEALEKVPPALKMAIFGIYVKISGRYIVLRWFSSKMEHPEFVGKHVWHLWQHLTPPQNDPKSR